MFFTDLLLGFSKVVAPLIFVLKCSQVFPSGALSIGSVGTRYQKCLHSWCPLTVYLSSDHANVGQIILPLILRLAISGKCVRYIEWQKESESEVAQSCLTLCDPMECSLPGSSIRGILQPRTQEWRAIYFSMGSSRPRDRTLACHTAGGLYSLSRQRRADRKPYPAFIVPWFKKSSQSS